MFIVLFFISMWYLSLFAQTFFQHRYAAHGAFTMNKFWERFFFIFTYLAQGPHYMSPKAYALMHRLHHAHTDTEKDPHSPNFSKNIFTMMLRARTVYNDIFRGRMKVAQKFSKNLPEWRKFDLMANSDLSRILWSCAYISIFIFFASSIWLWLLLPITIIMGPFHGAIINWFAHKVGYRNFNLNNTSENLVGIDLLMLGEAYHNNHHKFPSAVNFGYKWHEIDPIYGVMLLFNKLRIIQIKK